VKPCRVLFLCTGNSARSILAESLLDRLGGGRFEAHSAGSHPRGEAHPGALALLRERGCDASRLRSKSWDEYARPGAPELDLVVTVCASAAGEACPVWRGRPATAHWGIEDPAAAEGTEEQRREVFRATHRELERRIRRLVALPAHDLDRARLEALVREIGEREDA
jgi:arsenate reductase